MTNIRINGNRVIIKSSSITQNMINRVGIEMPTEFSFGEIINSSNQNDYPIGHYVCIPTGKLSDIPYQGSMEKLAIENSIEYVYEASEIKPKDKML